MRRESELARRKQELDEREARLRQAEPKPQAQPVDTSIVIPPSCFAPSDFKPTIIPKIKAVADNAFVEEASFWSSRSKFGCHSAP